MRRNVISSFRLLSSQLLARQRPSSRRLLHQERQSQHRLWLVLPPQGFRLPLCPSRPPQALSPLPVRLHRSREAIRVWLLSSAPPHSRPSAQDRRGSVPLRAQPRLSNG